MIRRMKMKIDACSDALMWKHRVTVNRISSASRTGNGNGSGNLKSRSGSPWSWKRIANGKRVSPDGICLRFNIEMSEVLENLVPGIVRTTRVQFISPYKFYRSNYCSNIYWKLNNSNKISWYCFLIFINITKTFLYVIFICYFYMLLAWKFEKHRVFKRIIIFLKFHQDIFCVIS